MANKFREYQFLDEYPKIGMLIWMDGWQKKWDSSTDVITIPPKSIGYMQCQSKLASIPFEGIPTISLGFWQPLQRMMNQCQCLKQNGQQGFDNH